MSVEFETIIRYLKFSRSVCSALAAYAAQVTCTVHAKVLGSHPGYLLTALAKAAESETEPKTPPCILIILIAA
jgi:hypothetical protein